MFSYKKILNTTQPTKTDTHHHGASVENSKQDKVCPTCQASMANAKDKETHAMRLACDSFPKMSSLKKRQGPRTQDPKVQKNRARRAAKIRAAKCFFHRIVRDNTDFKEMPLNEAMYFLWHHGLYKNSFTPKHIKTIRTYLAQQVDPYACAKEWVEQAQRTHTSLLEIIESAVEQTDSMSMAAI